jgi:hypothetical protein
MPYKLKQVPGGYYVETEETGHRHSKKPLSEVRATRQMQALYTHVPEQRGGVKIKRVHPKGWRSVRKFGSPLPLTLPAVEEEEEEEEEEDEASRKRSMRKNLAAHKKLLFKDLMEEIHDIQQKREEAITRGDSGKDAIAEEKKRVKRLRHILDIVKLLKKDKIDPEEEARQIDEIYALPDEPVFDEEISGEGRVTRQIRGSAKLDRNLGSRMRDVHFDTEGMTRSINNVNNRLIQTGNPLRPTQHFSNLYNVNSVVTQFPNNR